jgi:hypothetical protein
MELVEDMTLLDFDSGAFENEFDQHYGLLTPEQTVLVRAYSDDSDDRMLAEIRPKFIVMFEPNMEFIRRIEVSTFEPSSVDIVHGLFAIYRYTRPLIPDLGSEFIIWYTAILVRSINILLGYEKKRSPLRGLLRSEG